MPKIEDIFSIERNRQDESSWNKIHLFKTGEFYRAYEYSAWLTAEIAFNDKVRMQTLHIRNAYYGVEFLGTFIKPWRNYVSNKTLRRMRQHMAELQGCNQHRIQSAAISYMGVLSHTASHNIAMSKPTAA